MDIEITRIKIIYKLIAAGPQSQRILEFHLILQMIKEGRGGEGKGKLISISGFVLCSVMMFGLTSKNSLGW